MDIAAVRRVLDRTWLRGDGEWTLHVKVFTPGSIGPTPSVEVTGIDIGFDWNNEKLLINTAKPLTTLSTEDVAAIHASAKEGRSWHAYQQYQKQAAIITDLKEKLSKYESVAAEKSQ